ncbi:MAG: ABC transporter permease [Rubripirellula sp.]
MVKYVLKTLWRHRARTFLTVSGTAVAMFVFCLVGSVQQGMSRLTEDTAANQNLIVFQENRFCPASSHLPEDYAAKIEKLDGVREVIPVQVWTNNCRASLDIVVFNGAEPKKIKRNRRLTLTDGSWQTFSNRQDAAIVGRGVASRRNISLGDQFTIGDLSVYVAGIFVSDIPAEENLIYTDLRFLQLTSGLNMAGLVTQHEVVLNDSASPDLVASQIDALLRSSAVATKTRRKGAFQASTLSDLIDLIAFAHWLGYASIGLVLSLVATTTVMSVQDRMKEYAVLQTLGVRPSETVSLVLTESLFLCLIGGCVGTFIASITLFVGSFAIGAEGATIAFRPSLSLALSSVGISLAVGLIAGVAPAIRAATVNIANTLQDA